MSRNVLGVLVAAGATAVLFSSTTLAAEGDPSVVVNFEGRIFETQCEIGIENNSTVQLGQYPVGFFRNQDSESDAVLFNLEISRCRLTRATDNFESADEIPASRVRLTFTDNGVEDQTRERNGLLFLTGAEGQPSATNIGIRVQYENEGGDRTDVFDDAPTTDPLPVARTNYKELGAQADGYPLYQIPMYASMKRTSSQTMPTSGEVNGRMTVTLSYE